MYFVDKDNTMISVVMANVKATVLGTQYHDTVMKLLAESIKKPLRTGIHPPAWADMVQTIAADMNLTVQADMSLPAELTWTYQ